MKKPTLSRSEADEMIRWAVNDQVEAGLDIVTDGEGRRENMYYFFQKRLDGISFDNMHIENTGRLDLVSRLPMSLTASRIQGSNWLGIGRSRAIRRRLRLKSN